MWRVTRKAEQAIAAPPTLGRGPGPRAPGRGKGRGCRLQGGRAFPGWAIGRDGLSLGGRSSFLGRPHALGQSSFTGGPERQLTDSFPGPSCSTEPPDLGAAEPRAQEMNQDLPEGTK
ncbi:uncharacterized protein LOC101179566 [Nomascus leucogenys]|uniref:uncharacterized protein LOC101179566 n=1 Tax=Nomascus leucogenys TaxID=61853 RepID=UPI00122D63D1|nr:uncharacterized protein LOC101179566 [Nomascus leucogenys]